MARFLLLPVIMAAIVDHGAASELQLRQISSDSSLFNACTDLLAICPPDTASKGVVFFPWPGRNSLTDIFFESMCEQLLHVMSISCEHCCHFVLRLEQRGSRVVFSQPPRQHD